MRRFALIIGLAALLAGCNLKDPRRVDVAPLPSPTAADPAGDSGDPAAEQPDSAGQPEPPATSDGWEQLAPGVEFREIPATITNVQVVRIDPSQYSLRVAYDAGRIASGIVSQLAEGVRSAAEVDLGRARALVAERLTPFLRERL